MSETEHQFHPMPATIEAGLEEPRPPLRQRLKLANSVIWGGALLIGYLVYDSPRTFDLTYNLGLLIAVLSIYPTYRWARDMQHRYPIFEIFIATNLTTYAIPVISGTAQNRLFSPAVLSNATTTAAAFILAAFVGYYWVRVRPKLTRFWTENLFTTFRVELLSGALAGATIYVIVTTFFWSPPAGLAGILRAAFFGITTSTVFLLTMQWGRGDLPQRDRVVTTVCIVLQFIFLASSLVMRSGASLVLLGIIGFFFGARRVPWLVLIVVVASLGILHNGKFHMRGKYWFDDVPQKVELTDLPAYYQEWFMAGMAGDDETNNEEASSSLLERSSLIQMLCLVVDESPHRRPFLGGETYGHILGQFIPRFLWPDKPRGHVSTYRLSIYYGLQDEDATTRATIAFGLVPEAYANFGLLGVVGLGFLIGAVYKIFTRWSLNSPLFSPAGMLVILLTAWSFQTELTLSAWLGSFFQATIALMGMLFALRRLF